MQVILLERIESLGQMGDVVKVKPGYARNFLLPQKKAMRATKENLTYFEGQRAQLEAHNLSRRQEAEAIAQKLDGLDIVVIRQAGETGQLYGSVGTRDIAAAVTEAGFTIARRQVLLDQPIKSQGVFKTRLQLHPEVIVAVSINVAQSEDEAALQAAGKTAAPAVSAAPADTPPAAAVATAPAPDSADGKSKAAKKPKKARATAKGSADEQGKQ